MTARVPSCLSPYLDRWAKREGRRVRDKHAAAQVLVSSQEPILWLGWRLSSLLTDQSITDMLLSCQGRENSIEKKR
jgi:hypothetical protein